MQVMCALMLTNFVSVHGNRSGFAVGKGPSAAPGRNGHFSNVRETRFFHRNFQTPSQANGYQTTQRPHNSAPDFSSNQMENISVEDRSDRGYNSNNGQDNTDSTTSYSQDGFGVKDEQYDGVDGRASDSNQYSDDYGVPSEVCYENSGYNSEDRISSAATNEYYEYKPHDVNHGVHYCRDGGAVAAASPQFSVTSNYSHFDSNYMELRSFSPATSVSSKSTAISRKVQGSERVSLCCIMLFR